MRRAVWTLAIAALAVAALLVWRVRQPRAPGVIATLPDFSFTERDGSTVTRHDLLGHPWVADFIFTRCKLYCPRLTARMKELRRRLPDAVKSVSFTVDPEHDTPEVLSDYARQWQIEGRQWLFLTGPRDAMWTLIRKGFLLPVEAAPQVPDSPILHPNRFVLVDERGRTRNTYDAFDRDALDRLLRDLAGLDAESGS